MNIRDLKYVVAVAEHRHFGRAAAACYVSQPALSGQIRKLEDYLGVVVFERTKRSVKVTSIGEQIVVHARAVLEQVEVIEQTAQACADPLSGQLRVGMIPTIGPYLTPCLLPSIARSLPRLELWLSEDITEVLENDLLDGRIDAAVVATPVEDSRLAEIPLYDEPFWLALPHSHALVNEEEIGVSEIGDNELLLLEDGHCFRDQVLAFCSSVSDHAFNVKTQHTSLTTILALVGSGAGVTLVPAMSLSASWMTDSGIAVRKEKSRSALRSVRFAYRKTFPRRTVLERLADIVCAAVPNTVSPVRR